MHPEDLSPCRKSNPAVGPFALKALAQDDSHPPWGPVYSLLLVVLPDMKAMDEKFTSGNAGPVLEN